MLQRMMNLFPCAVTRGAWRPHLVLAVFCLFSAATPARAEPKQEEGLPPAVATADDPAASRPVVQQYGLSFVLVSSLRTDTVTTEEYIPEGEDGDDWSQMLTYQRILLPEPLPTDRFVMLLKRHLELQSVPPASASSSRVGRRLSLQFTMRPVIARPSRWRSRC